MKKILISLFILNLSFLSLFASYSAVVDNKTELESANSLAEQKIINDNSENPDKYNLSSHVLRQEIAAVAR
jgi:hypothetical protein